ncbi:MAG TPA: extracellular solute-binding protein [Clostridiales bacterium]|nr:extracellular solute-binding protein [Clostridiales bacterium]
MNKISKRIVGLMLAIMILATLFTGCSSGKDSDIKTPEGTPDVSKEKGDDEEGEANGDTLFEETLKFSYMSNIWGDHPEYPEEENVIIEELMRRTNTEIEFRWYPVEQYEDKVTVTLASDDIPDMIAQAPTSTLIDEGAIIPLDDLLKEHGQNILAYLEEEDYPYMREAVDGNIYAIPFILDFPPAYAMQIRKDWLDRVGIDKVPETWDEWKEAWHAFKDEDANGDGDPTNEIPYAGDVYGLLPAFGINVSNKIGFTEDADGNYTLMYELPEFKTFLEEMRYMYKEGLLDKEFATRGTFVDNPGLEKVCDANLAGSVMTWAANTRRTTEVLREIDPDAAMIGVKPIQGPNGKQGIPSRVRVTPTATITIAGEDKAEDIVKFFNYVFSEEGINLMSYGIEGEHHEREDSRLVLKSPYVDSFENARKAGLNLTPFPHLFTEDAFMQITLGGMEYEELPEPMQFFYDALYVGEDYFFTPTPTLNTEAYTEKQGDVFPQIEAMLAQCITGEISIDEFYNQYEKLKPVGLQDILDQGNEAWQMISK